MRILPKRIISINVAVLASVLCLQAALCRADDVQVAAHELAGPPFFSARGDEWQARKKALAVYSPGQLVRALINEIDIDRGSPILNRIRNVQIYEAFRALDLPPAFICEEIDKPQAPERKAVLIFLLRDCKRPEVTQVLLRQLSDLRRVEEWDRTSKPPVHPLTMRIRDYAYNALVGFHHGPNLMHAPSNFGEEERDRLIQDGLARLKLTPP